MNIIKKLIGKEPKPHLTPEQEQMLKEQEELEEIIQKLRLEKERDTFKP